MEFLGNPSEAQLDIYFYNQIPITSIENHLKATTAKRVGSDIKISQNVDMIMPLMFETWMEVKPSQTKTLDGATCASVSHEDSITLKVVMDIIMELFQMVENSSDDAKQKFLKKYQEKFELHIVSTFPYAQDDSSKKTPESGGGKCVYQNLSIAILFIVFTSKHRQRFWKHRERVFAFVEDCISNWKPKDQEFNKLMKKFIRMLFTAEMQAVFLNESKQIFSQLIRKCNVDQSSYDPKLALVCEIIEGSTGVKKDSVYGELVPQLVQVLSQKEIVPVHIIRTVTTLAKQGNPVIHELLNEKMSAIVQKLLGTMRISGSSDMESNRWKKEIANLVYWVKTFESIQEICNHLKEDSISKYIKDIIDVKKSEQ